MLITEFHKYMEISGASERHQNNSLKMVIAFAFFIGKDVTLDDINSKEQICSFLDTKIKNQKRGSWQKVDYYLEWKALFSFVEKAL